MLKMEQNTLLACTRKPEPTLVSFRRSLYVELLQDRSRWGQDGDDGGHSRWNLVGPESPANQLQVDGLTRVAEDFHGLLVGVSLDVHAVHLQGRRASGESYTDVVSVVFC